jgi:AcrR family transcriptional regulator/DNA-binding MarR family transcriptional regulator
MPARARSRRAVPVSGVRRGVRRPVSGAAVSAAGEGVSHAQIVEIQRSRLLAAAVKAVDELGYADTSVSDVTNRARVSRRTFYELFSNREECLIAVLEDVVALIAGEVSHAGVEGLAWCERVRTGLWVILSFLDREPVLARVCVIQALRGGPEVLRRRERLLAGLAGVVDEGRGEGPRGERCSRLTAEGVVGAAFAIVYARLLRGEREPLTDLVGELMGMIVLPYRGAAAARREQARPMPVVSGARGGGVSGRAVPGCAVADPLEGVSMRLTYRTARVLRGVAECPGASNRQVAERAGIHDPGQVSKLLARLERLGLLANASEGHAKGEPNAWSLTAKGQRVAQSIHAHAPGEREAA